MFLRVKVTGSSKMLIFIGCSETDVMSDSILPKSPPSSVGSGDLNNQKDKMIKTEMLHLGQTTAKTVQDFRWMKQSGEVLLPPECDARRMPCKDNPGILLSCSVNNFPAFISHLSGEIHQLWEFSVFHKKIRHRTQLGPEPGPLDLKSNTRSFRQPCPTLNINQW